MAKQIEGLREVLSYLADKGYTLNELAADDGPLFGKGGLLQTKSVAVYGFRYEKTDDGEHRLVRAKEHEKPPKPPKHEEDQEEQDATPPYAPPAVKRKIGQPSPVLVVNLEQVGKTGEDFDALVVEALGSMALQGKELPDVSLWGREAPGVDAHTNEFSMLFFVHVLTEKRSSIAAALARVLRAAWGNRACTLEEGRADGMEYPILGVVDRRVVSHRPPVE